MPSPFLPSSDQCQGTFLLADWSGGHEGRRWRGRLTSTSPLSWRWSLLGSQLYVCMKGRRGSPDKCCSDTCPFCLVQALKFDVKSGAQLGRDRQTPSGQSLLNCCVFLVGFLISLTLWPGNFLYAVRSFLLLKRFNKYLSGIFSFFQQECWFKFLAHHNLTNGNLFIYFLRIKIANKITFFDYGHIG